MVCKKEGEVVIFNNMKLAMANTPKYNGKRRSRLD
jgi:hypothetical protein